MNFVLITPARNEEAGIERTLASMVAQACRPLRWVNVDDGSTDRKPTSLVRWVGRRWGWHRMIYGKKA
jgi:glycosyltransferase involved in cell wall biosynthesis